MNGSKPEIALRRALHAHGFRFFVDYRKAPGRPDLAFSALRLAVFVDGDHWHHGRRCPQVWRTRVDANRRRDDAVNQMLKEQGWTVLRFAEHEILRDVDSCVEQVRAASVNV